MEYPLAERELRRLAQRPMTFATRAALALVATPILSFFFLADTASGGVAAQADEIAGVLLFVGYAYLFVVSVLVPPFLTAGLIANEKHERTLGTLLIADFSASDVILSKFVPALIQVELLVVGSLPVLAFATILGGITPIELLLAVMLFSVSALFAASLGLFASTVARQTGGALMGTIVLLAPMLAIDMGLANAAFASAGSPFPVLVPAMAVVYLTDSPSASLWLPSVLIAFITSPLLVLTSIALLPRQVYAARVRTPRFRALRRPINPFLRERGTSLIFSRAAGGLSAAVRSVFLKCVFAFALALIAVIPCGVGLLFVAGVVMFDVVSTMDNAKRSAVLDDIRLSAPDPKTFLWDIYYALWMRGWFYIPGIVVGTMTISFGFPFSLFVGTAAIGTDLESVLLVLIAIVAVLIVGFAQLALMTAIGCYQSGYGRNVRAQTLTCVLLYVVVGMVTGFGFLIAGVIGDAILSGGGPGLGAEMLATAVVTALFTGVLALWTLGFYGSYRTRHLKYV